MYQIPVCAMQFDNIEARLESALGSRRKALHNHANIGDGEFGREGISGREGNGTRRDRLPPALLSWYDVSTPPRRIGTALSAGMRELNTGNRTVLLQKARYACERLDVLVFPDAQVQR